MLPLSHSISDYLTHTSWQLRLSALHLLVTSNTPSVPLQKEILQLLRDHLDDFFANTDAEFRNRVFSIFRILINRLLASSYALNTKIEKSLQYQKVEAGRLKDEKSFKAQLHNLSSDLKEIEAFVTWILHVLLPAQIRLGSSFQRTVLALRVYTLWKNLDTKLAVPLLVEKDTSESRKQSRGSKKNHTGSEQIIFPFVLDLNNPQLQRQLLERIIDPFDDVRSLSADVLKQLCHNNAPHWELVLNRAADAMSVSGRAGEADGLARLLDVMFDIVLHNSKRPSMLWGVHIDQQKSAAVAMVCWILDLLEKESSHSQKDSTLGVGVYGVMGGLKYILQRKTFSSNHDTEIFDANELWTEVLKRTPKSYFEIWKSVQPLLCDEAPEGRLGTESRDNVNLDEIDDNLTDDKSKQKTLSSSWRIVSEARCVTNHLPYDTY